MLKVDYFQKQGDFSEKGDRETASKQGVVRAKKGGLTALSDGLVRIVYRVTWLGQTTANLVYILYAMYLYLSHHLRQHV